MKKALLFEGLTLLLLIPIFLYSWVIITPTEDECHVIEITISNVFEGGTKDIVFADTGTDRFYINRGLEQGLAIEDLKSKVINKKATLHLPKLLFGLVESEHISQLEVEGEILFTEFN